MFQFLNTFVRPFVTVLCYRSYVKKDLAREYMSRYPTLTMDEALHLAQEDINADRVPALHVPTLRELWQMGVSLGKIVFWGLVAVVVLGTVGMIRQSSQDSKEAAVLEPQTAAGIVYKDAWLSCYDAGEAANKTILAKFRRHEIRKEDLPPHFEEWDMTSGVGGFATPSSGPKPDEQAAKSEPPKEASPAVIPPVPTPPPVAPDEPSEYQQCLWQGEADAKRGVIAGVQVDAAFSKCDALPRT